MLRLKCLDLERDLANTKHTGNTADEHKVPTTDLYPSHEDPPPMYLLPRRRSTTDTTDEAIGYIAHASVFV